MKEGQKIFGENIAVIINSTLLTIVYILGIGLTSIVAKIFNRHFLDLEINAQESYWKDLNLGRKPFGEYYRQF